VHEGEILVEVRACSICGGDLKIYRDANRPLPHFMFGHEVSGVVVQVGAGVERFREGDRVAYAHNNYCGTCAICRAGSPAWCKEFPLPFRGGGGFADYVLFQTPPRGCGVYKIPDNLGFPEAALAEPLDCALGAVMRSRPLPAEVAVVIGLGGMGHLISQVLNALHVKVIGVDLQEAKRHKAAPYCVLTLDPSGPDGAAIQQQVMDYTSGQGADIVFEAVGKQATLTLAFELIKIGGRLIQVGVFARPMDNFDPDRWLFRKDVTMIPAKGPAPWVTTAGESLALDMLSRGVVQAESVVSVFHRQNAAAAFEAQDTGGAVRSVILPE